MGTEQGMSGAGTEPLVRPIRGGWLTTWLVLIITLNSAAALLYFSNPDLAMRRLPRLSHGLVTLMGLVAVVNVALAILVWNWRRVGLWGLVAAALLAFSINLYVGVGLIQATIGLLGPVILGLLVRPKWSSFK